MALASGSVFNITSTATTSNVNGAGFNPANANFPTDLTTDANTANTASPVVSSATYSFVAGDIGAAVYIKSGTNWTVGFYPIASVAGGKATLNAAIGLAWQLSATTNMYAPSTVVGCATVGTPTSGTYGVNYAMLDTAPISAIADFNAVGASTTLTSVTAGFTPVMVGNFFHQTTTGTGAFGLVGWYEIVSYTNVTTVVLDRTPNNGTASVNTTGYVGGAGRFNGLENTFQAMIPSNSRVMIKNGTYTFSAAVSTESTNSTSALPSFFIGYTTVWGDTCNMANRPIFAAGANTLDWSQYQMFYNISFTGTAAPMVTAGLSMRSVNCKFHNSSATAGRIALNSAVGFYLYNCEIISQNGTGQQSTTFGQNSYGCYYHDCVNGIISSGASTNIILSSCIIEACSTAAVQSQSSGGIGVFGCTFYGREAKMGIGIDYTVANSPLNAVFNTIFYGLTTGMTVATGASNTNSSINNDFFNNTTDATRWNKSDSDLALDPQFTGATQITGTTASGSGSVLTDTNADFSSVTDNVDFVRVISGTGATVGNYLITSHTTTTLTCNNTVGTNATADRVYFVTTGHNFGIGTNLKAQGFPSFVNSGSESIGYMDIGAVQRQEAGGGLLTHPGMQGGCRG